MLFPFSDEELMTAVERTLDKVRPMLVRDGGNVELVRVKGREVFVRLTGACVGCSSSNDTLKFGIEKALRVNIHSEMTVIEERVSVES